MRAPVVITGLGVVSSVGTTRDAFFAALAEGRAGIRPHATLADGVALSAIIDDLGARRWFDARTTRRMARVSVMALLAAREAMEQGNPTPAYSADRLGVVFGTGLGSMRETFEFIGGYVTGGDEGASPMLFPSSVMNAAAGQVAIELGLRGANTTVNHRDASVLDAFAVAADLLELGRADALFVGGVDEVSHTSLAAYRYLARLSPTGIRPYAANRDGTVPGEGAAVFLVEREEDARRRGATILARVGAVRTSGIERPRVGWGHGEGAWQPAAKTIRAAIDEAGLAPEKIGYVAGAGCGLGVDELEARAVTAVLGPEAPIGSIVGQTGEFMAGSALRVASAVYALTHQMLPGTVGAGETPSDLPLPGLVRSPRPVRLDAVLVPSLAQGGSDGALVLTR